MLYVHLLQHMALVTSVSTVTFEISPYIQFHCLDVILVDYNHRQ